MKLFWKIIKIISDKSWFYICHFIPKSQNWLPEGALNSKWSYWYIKWYWKDFHNWLELELDWNYEPNKYMPDNQFAKQYTPKLIFSFNKYEVIWNINEDLILKDFFIKNVPFVWWKTADLLFSTYNWNELLDILKEEKNKAVSKLQNIKWFWKKKAEWIFNWWTELSDRREVLIWLFKYWLSLKQSNKLYDYFWTDVVKQIEKNPYIITEAKGIWLAVAEKVAENMWIKKDSQERYIAIINHFIKEISKTDTLVWKDNIISHVNNYILNEEKDNSKLFELKVEDIVDIWIKWNIEKKFIKQINDNIFILSSFEKIEKSIFEWVKDRKDKENNISIDIKELEWIDFLTEEQLSGVEKCLKKKISVLVWPAWSWKTTTSQFIVKWIKKMWKSLIIIAPTNKAVARIKEVNWDNIECLTIHKLLWLKPWSNDAKYNENKKLPYDYIIMDETSMSWIYNIFLLIKAIDINSNIIFLWDNNQLPSIEAGSFFNDIVESSYLKDNLTRLTVVKRVENSKEWIGEIEKWVNNIIANSQRILKGEKPVSTNSNSFCKVYERIGEEEKEDIYKYIRIIYQKLKDNWIDYNKDFQILIPTYRWDLWINKINELVSEITNTNSAIEVNNWKFKKWDKIFYDDKHIEYWLVKWDTWYVVDIFPEKKKISCYFYNLKKTFDFSFIEAWAIKLWYCLSIHKSQGSEYPYVFVILTSQAFTMLSRNLLYTWYTRWKKKVYLFCDTNALRTALKEKESAKNTYLFNLLEWIEDEEITLVKDRSLVSITPEQQKFVKDELNKKWNLEYKLVKIKHDNKKYLWFSYLYADKELIKNNDIFERSIISVELSTKIVNEWWKYMKIVNNTSEISKSAFSKKEAYSELMICWIEKNTLNIY